VIKKYNNVDKDVDVEEKAPVMSTELARQKEKTNKIDAKYKQSLILTVCVIS
jgi:hypothetical protein